MQAETGGVASCWMLQVETVGKLFITFVQSDVDSHSDGEVKQLHSVGWWLHQAASLSLCKHSQGHSTTLFRGTKYKVTADHQHEGKGHTDEEGTTFLQRLYDVY